MTRMFPAGFFHPEGEERRGEERRGEYMSRVPIVGLVLSPRGLVLGLVLSPDEILDRYHKV